MGRLVLVLVLFGFVSSVAHAGACPHPKVRVFPAGDGVPRNAEVWITFQDRQEVQVVDIDPESQIRSEIMAPRDATVLLREQPSGTVVPANVHWLPGTDLPTIVLHPKRALHPHATYDVVIHRTRDHSVGRFATGTTVDTSPPSLGRVARGQVYRQVGRDWKDPSGTAATLTLAGVVDDAPSRLRVEIYDLSSRHGATEANLRTVAWVVGSKVIFGALSACTRDTFQFPVLSKRAARRCGPRDRRLPIGLRLVDAAGNRSALRTIDLDLDCVRTRR